MTRVIVAAAALALACACSESREKAIEKINQDEQTVKWASAAVNQVIRNSPDCEAAKPLMEEAYQRIEEARKKVTAPATGATLDALKAQVDRVARACP
jgi:pyridoxal/pyridoxine/pyridoxamine kinase